MTQLQWQQWCARVDVVAAVMCGLGFIAQYTYYSPWWHDRIGRTVVAMDIAIFCALFPSMVFTFFPYVFRSPGVREVIGWVEVAALACIPAVLVIRMAVWHREESGRRAADKLRKLQLQVLREKFPDWDVLETLDGCYAVPARTRLVGAPDLGELVSALQAVKP